MLLAATEHVYGGRRHDDRPAVRELAAGLPGLEHVVLVGDDADGEPLPGGPPTTTWTELLAGRDTRIQPVPVPFDHPLWVLFSSGTTGVPKGIVHGHGGVVLEHLKLNALHLDLAPGDRMLWYTTPSWMMWNALVAVLLCGVTMVCVDGSPGHPDVGRLWRVAAQVDATLLGTSPAYLSTCRAAGVDPRAYELDRLRSVGVTGSPFSADLGGWLTDHLPHGVRVATTSGGTDVVTAFAGPSPWTEHRPGELSAACLGVALDAFDAAGHPVRGEVGELVVRRPMPSMPVGFWDDPGGRRMADAYFSTYAGVWRHGDWVTVTARGSVIIHGRSDATLNRRGIRLGSADIYAVVEALPFVAEALVVGVEEPDGGYWMPMFVVIVAGVALDESLRADIRTAIAAGASPRHVPDEILALPAVPHTRTGKKLEVPVKRLLAGEAIEHVVDAAAVDRLDVLETLATIGRARHPRSIDPVDANHDE